MTLSVLNTFYNSLVKEASEGRVDCYFKFNVCFGTYIRDLDCFIPSKINNKNYLVPILVINDFDLFNNLLVQYVDMSLNYYKDEPYFQELDELDDSFFYKQKMVLCLLWSNATIGDFNNPEEYLKKRINFMRNYMEEKIYLGFSSVLKANLECIIFKDRIFNETPNSIVFKAYLDDKVYYFPVIRFGISDDIVYIYAMQKNIKFVGEETFSKKINRQLYKVNEGVDINDKSCPNIMNVTSSFVVAGDLFIWLFNELGFKNFKAISPLPIRWNSKNIKNQKSGFACLKLKEKQDYENATKKFFNTFRRISYHNNNLYALQNGENLEIKVSEFEDYTNNKVFNEIKSLTKNNNSLIE